MLTRIRNAGLTRSKEKCEFNKTSIKFLGQLVDEEGVKPDPDKVIAIREMKQPENITELRRFLGMVNQLTKSSPHLADQTKPMRDLLSTKNQWVWGEEQERAFQSTKSSLSSSEVLTRYDATRPTVISADASSYGLGAVIRQKQPNGELRPVAYISRYLKGAERHYEQIEKEALGVTWACERFQDYFLGKTLHVETDHKPLLPLLSNKPLSELPLRVQRFQVRLMRFNYTISHVPGKELSTADAHSRAPVTEPSLKDVEFQKEVHAYLGAIVQSIPATEKYLTEIQTAQMSDSTCQILMQYCEKGWPSKSTLPEKMKPYYSVRNEIAVHDDLLFRGSRIIIPKELRHE